MADPARLAEQRRRLPQSSWERLFENRWTAAEDRLAHPDDVAACALLDGPLAPQPGIRYAVGLDVGLTNDRTVAVVCHLEDRPGAEGLTSSTQRVVLDRLAVWAGSRVHPVELAVVEEWVAQAAASFNRAPVIADPWQAVGLAQRLRRRGIAVEDFTFSSASTVYAALRVNEVEPGTFELSPRDDLDDEADVYRAWRQSGNRARNRIRDEELSRVAEIYRTAMAQGDPPTKTVGEVLHLDRSTAGRWVMRARRAGFLPTTDERKAKA